MQVILLIKRMKSSVVERERERERYRQSSQIHLFNDILVVLYAEFTSTSTDKTYLHM